MIPKECKRLIEVDFPIAVVSKHSAREKSIRHGHPSTLHLWWARRPLAACRAVLLGLLLPDPCDPHCPDDFKPKARKALQGVTNPGTTDEALRKAILKFIGDFANWDNSSHPTYLRAGRELVRAAHPEETPLVVDPFAGGGSIPLEALRLGCDAFASDLNPVACLILKVMLEDIPRHGPELADELRRVGKEIKHKAEKELAEFYPKDPDGATPIAYLWARTVRCEAPNCGAEIPLMRSFWLCKKANRKRALRSKVVPACRQAGAQVEPRVEFEVFEPKNEKEVPQGTVTRAKATCLCCNMVLPPERVRAQLREQRGGADVIFDEKGNRVGGARMTAVVTLQLGVKGRHYRLPAERDYEAVWKAQKRLKAILDEWERGGRRGLCPIPDEPTPAGGGSGAGRAFSVQKYGMMQWGDLFTARQKVALASLSRLLSEQACAPSNRETLALSVSRFADIANCLCRWENTKHQIRNLFSRQALPIVWDFAEANLFGGQAGDHSTTLGTMIRVVDQVAGRCRLGHVQQADAMQHPLPDQSAGVWFTDPPYYDAIPYADLADFFFVWLKRVMPDHPLVQNRWASSTTTTTTEAPTTTTQAPLPDEPLGLTPKAFEIVEDETKDCAGVTKDRAFFESAMARSFFEGRRILREEGIGAVVFAHKSTEGWEALLSGMIRGGWTITGSWPIATEAANRLRARDSAALATSVHLVCRPRPEDASVGDWAEVLRELPRRVGDWMERLQGEGIRGADLVFACIGPALEIFSRYRHVETAEGREVTLPEYLAKVWEVVGRTALEQILGTAEARARNGLAGALEEDARLTALFLWTLQSTANGNGTSTTESTEDTEDDGDEDEQEGTAARKKPKGQALIYDVVRRFAQPLGIHLDDWEDRIIETKKGVVRLMSVSERARQLFGEAGAQAAADWIESTPTGPVQVQLFVEEGAAPEIRGRKKRKRHGALVSDEDLKTQREATTLDRVHAAMLLQAGGRAAALRALLKAEIDRSPDFLRLANALSALYPRGSEEKRLLDAMLLAVPR